MIDINQLTLAQIKELSKIACCDNDKQSAHPYAVGNKYLIRTVTHYYSGRIVAIYTHELVLEDAAWIPDTGRLGDCLKDGKFNEIEPIPGRLIIGRGAIVDCIAWEFDLPRIKK